MKNYFVNKKIKEFLLQKLPAPPRGSRNPVIDIAKGILILCLLYNHTPVFSFIAGMHDPVVKCMEESKTLFSIFFMQAFFLITGFCSSFNKKFLPFLWSNIKTLLIPMYVLGKLGSWSQQLIFDQPFEFGSILPFYSWFMAGGQWFIIALFFCKLIYWMLNKYSQYVQISIISSLYLIGFYCYIFLWQYPEYLNYKHILLMLPFIYIGNLLKQYHSQIGKYMPCMAIVGAILIVTENLVHWIYGISIPVLDAGINIPYYLIPLHFLNAICGTALILWISKKLQNHGTWLIRVGSYTLVFYLWNAPIHPLIIHFMQPFYNPNSIPICLLFHTISLILCIIASYYVSRLIYETKYLKWIVGKL